MIQLLPVFLHIGQKDLGLRPRQEPEPGMTIRQKNPQAVDLYPPAIPQATPQNLGDLSLA